MPRLCSVIGAAVLSSFGVYSQAPPAETRPRPAAIRTPPANSDTGALRTGYTLGPDDQIVIRAADVPDINDKPLRLDLNGDIKVPMVGRIHAAGLTVEQLEAEITKRLKIYLQEPEVTVSVAEFHSQPVSVIGEVSTPGVQQLQGRKTLIEILSTAGGLRTTAGPTARITRRVEWGRIPLPGAADDATGAFNVAEVDLKSLLSAKNPERNIFVQPFDVISVPRAEIVYVLGEVGKAGPIELGEGHSISVLEAVSSAGGATRTAGTAKAKILRPIMGGPKRAELEVDIKKITQGKASDVPLLAGDILYVPDSKGARVTARALEAAIQAGTIVGTYGVIH